MEEEAAQSKGSNSGKFGSKTQRQANSASEELGHGIIGVAAGLHVSTCICVGILHAQADPVYPGRG